MVSFCRSGLLALTLVGGLVTEAAGQTQRIQHRFWASDVTRERLQDNSVLTEYFGESSAENPKNAVLRVGFIPRFGCAPLITMKFGLTDAASDSQTPVRNPADLNMLSVNIDGTALPFPLLLDRDADHVSVYLNANLQRRLTTKLRIEVGNRMYVRTRNGEAIRFSLLGSRDAISIAHQNCRRHDPSVQG